jgi:hypothetical protein
VIASPDTGGTAGKYDEIVALTDPFCPRHLIEEYRNFADA